MRVTALVCEVTSHLDFGGFGFVRLADAFAARGHNLSWIAGPTPADWLKSRGFSVRTDPHIRRLTDVEKAQTKLGARMGAALAGADLILCDMRLAALGPIARSLGIPLVGVGWPGGRWDDRTLHGLNSLSPVPGAGPSRLLDQAEAFAVFLPRRFYGGDLQPTTLSIHHLDTETRISARDPDARRITVTLGSKGDPSRVARYLSGLPADFTVDLFHSASNAEDHAETFARLRTDPRVRLRGWQDLRTAVAPSAYAVTLGGISSIWRALALDLPMLGVPVGRGDQGYNCARIEASGLGRRLPPDIDDEAALTVHRDMMRRSVEAPPSAVISADDYDCGLEQAVGRFERLV